MMNIDIKTDLDENGITEVTKGMNTKKRQILLHADAAFLVFLGVAFPVDLWTRLVLIGMAVFVEGMQIWMTRRLVKVAVGRVHEASKTGVIHYIYHFGEDAVTVTNAEFGGHQDMAYTMFKYVYTTEHYQIYVTPAKIFIAVDRARAEQNHIKEYFMSKNTSLRQK